MTGTDIKYSAIVDLGNRNTSHSLMHELVVQLEKPPMSVLEVGCSSGYFGSTLVARGHHVTGVEPDRASFDAARLVLDEVFNGGIDEFFETNPGRQFDAIIFGDVLEHLGAPEMTLRRSLHHLADGGAIIVSLPCVTHGSVRAMMLEGRWEYSERGLLDRTHVHFFSRKGVAGLMADAGLKIGKLHGIVVPIENVSDEYGMQLRPQSIAAVESLAEDGDVYTFQFVLRAQRPTGAEATGNLLAHNRAQPVEFAAEPPRPSGHRSTSQQWRLRLFRTLLARITARRFRDSG